MFQRKYTYLAGAVESDLNAENELFAKNSAHFWRTANAKRTFILERCRIEQIRIDWSIDQPSADVGDLQRLEKVET